MELPPFHHHRHRYVPHPSNFSENPNFYHRLPPPTQQLQQPPPLPPLPPPPSHHLSHPRPPPPPPPQSQFSFRPHHPVEQRPIPAAATPPAAQFSNFILPHLLNQTRPLSPHRLPPPHHHIIRQRNPTFCNENPRFSDPWLDLPPPPRAPIEPDFRYQPQRHPLSPLPPQTKSYMNNFDRSLRFRDDLLSEEFRDIAKQEIPWGGRKERDFDLVDDGNKYWYNSGHDGFEKNINPGFERDIDRANRDLVSADSRGIDISRSPSRDFTLNVGNYESYNDREEDLRWGYSRLENDTEYVMGDRVSLSSHGVRELLDSGYDDANRLRSGRVEEGAEEFYSSSPRKKQVQKKSALLRIQLGKGNSRNNYRNRSHDNSRYSRAYYDDSNLSFGGSFKGKEKDDFVHPDWKTEEQREKSPVELDVSFKSNSLVAKAKKATSNPVVESKRNLAPRNRKLKKMNSIDSPGIKLSEDSIKATSCTGVFDASSVSDKDHKEFTEKIISFKSDSSTGGLISPSSSDKHSKESAEKVFVIKTDSCVHGLDFPSGSGIDMGLLTKETSLCDSRPNIVDGTITGKESEKLVGSDQGAKRVAPDGVLLKRAKKWKTVRNSLQNETTSPHRSSTHSWSAASQPEEGVTHSSDSIPSARMDSMNDVLLPSPANDLTVKEVNNASENVVSDKDGVVISSSVPIQSQFSALISVSSNPGDTEGSGHADRLVLNDLSGLKSDKNLVESQTSSVPSLIGDLDDADRHPCLNGSSLAENDFLRKVTLPVESNAGLSSLKENHVHDGQIDASTSNHDARTTSAFDQRLCRRPVNITVANKAFVNADSKELLQNQVNVSHEDNIDGDSPDPHLSVTVGPSKIEKPPAHETAENLDLSNNSSSSPSCSTSVFLDSLGKRTVSDVFLLEISGKQSIVNGATTLPVNPPVETSPKSMVTHSSKVGRKRKDRDDRLDVHDKETNKRAGSVASTLDEGPAEFNPPAQGRKKGNDFSLILPSPVLSEISQDPKDAIISCPPAECLSNNEEHTTQPEDRVDPSCPGGAAFAGLTAFSEASVILLQEGIIAGESCQSLEGGIKGQGSTLEHGTSSPPKWKADKNDNSPLILSASDLQLTDDTLSVSGEGNFVRSDMNEKQCFGDGYYENQLLLKENLTAFSDNVSLCADVAGVSASSSTDIQIDSVPDTLSCMGSPEDVISNMSSDILNNNLGVSQLSDIFHGNESISNKNPISGGDRMSLSLKPYLHTSKTIKKSGDAVSLDLAVNTNGASLLSRNTFKVTQDSNPIPKKSSLTNNRLSSSVIGDLPAYTSIKYPSTAKISPFNHIGKPRTWHRTLNSSPSVVGPKSHGNCIHPQTNAKKEASKVQSSYVRRGNSLVREPSPVGATLQVLQASRSSVHHLNSVIPDGRKGKGLENRITVVDPPGSATSGAFNTCAERLQNPPLMGSVKLLNCMTPNQVDLTFSQLDDPPRNECPDETNDPSKSTEDMDTMMSSEDKLKSSGVEGCQTGSNKDLDYQSNADERINGKKISYVKRSSNQLVAASDSDDLSLSAAEKTQVFSSVGYYKRRKNQLIRTSLEEGVKQRAVIPDKILSSQQQDAQKNIQSRSSSKRQSGKGFVKKKFSLVWTLHETVSSRKDGSSGRWQRMLPYLFPWRRATYWANFMHSLSAIPIDSSTSTIGQKLLLSRKRDAIYKRSISGFSLRRSKVLSVGGRSLKWSKSIEKNSRKADEDATLAVVAAEKRKRARNGAAFTLSNSRNYVSRKRIFRIGSERYRMDPTRKTLQRISDDQPSYSDVQPGKNRKKFYVPKRLLIGSDEYIRIGNGNQLVRDPKRRTRILANEKVRWSLHTARLRLARKKKYCQFFTRFGKCNKDDKKCPYIHDPSKIAVCTKFLNGSCSDPDCKLTHQVIPERMQDCSYFLQGLCSNESCPYRHVNVNPNSPICEGFLRGYCADGNECRKKHTYVCPVFEATGNCPQGPKCKLHHPKKKRKGMKGKASNAQKNARGRYFGSRPVNVAVSRATVSEISSGKDDDIFGQDGKLADYISLDVSIEEMEQVFELKSGPTCDSEEPSHMQIAEDDELTKPVRLMNKNLIVASSPAVDSSSEMTPSYVSEECQ